MPRPHGTNYRAKQALELRDAGIPLEEIAKAMNLKCAEHASQYIRRARRSMKIAAPKPTKLGKRVSYHRANAA